MNKIFNRIALAFVGLTMAIGVGVASSSSNRATGVRAETDTTMSVTTTSGTSWTAENGAKSTFTGASSAAGSYYNVQKADDVTSTAFNVDLSENVTVTIGAGYYGGKSAYVTCWLSSGDTVITTTTAVQPSTNKNASYSFTLKPTSGNNTNKKVIFHLGLTEASTSKFARLYSISIAYKAAESATLSSIAVKTAPTTTTYYAGDKFNPAGLVITATYDDASTEDVAYADNSDAFTFSPDTSTALTTSDDSVTITYGGKTTTQAITVNAARTVTGVSLDGDMENKSYTEGDSWDLTGLYLTVTWSDGKPTEVQLTSLTKDTDYLLGEDAPTVGLTSLYISGEYEGEDFEKTVTGITVVSKPLADSFDNSVTSSAASSGWTTFSKQTDYTGVEYTIYTMKPSTGNLLQWNTNGYMIATGGADGLTLKSVSIASISSGKSLGVFASNSVYSAKPTGTQLGQLSNDALTYEFKDSYSYIGLTGLGTSTAVGTVTITYESADPTLEFTNGGTTANLTVVNGSTNSTTFEASNFDSVTAGLFSNNEGSHSSLAYAVSETTVTVTATGTSVGSDAFTISATGCETTLTLNVTVQASTTFDSLVITTATTATSFTEGDAFAVTGMVVTANYTVGGEESSTDFSGDDLSKLTYTVGGTAVAIGETLDVGTGTKAVVVSYTDSATGTTKSAEAYDIEISAYVGNSYTKVTSDLGDWRGTYLLISTFSGTDYVFDGSLTSFDVASNWKTDVEVSDGKVEVTKSTTAIDTYTFSIGRTSKGYYIKSASGYYIANTTASNSLKQSNSTVYSNSIAWDGDNNCVKITSLENDTATYLRAYSGNRFRYFTGVTTGYAVDLYKLNDNDYVSEATTWANTFLKEMSCGGKDGDKAGTITALDGTWESQATAFNALSVDAQGYLANLTGDQSDGATGAAGAVGRYDYIIDKYGTDDYIDFMNRVSAGTLVISSSRINLSVLGSQNNVTIMIIALVSIVVVITASGYFFLRKRKEQ